MIRSTERPDPPIGVRRHSLGGAKHPDQMRQVAEAGVGRDLRRRPPGCSQQVLRLLEGRNGSIYMADDDGYTVGTILAPEACE